MSSVSGAGIGNFDASEPSSYESLQEETPPIKPQNWRNPRLNDQLNETLNSIWELVEAGGDLNESLPGIGETPLVFAIHYSAEKLTLHLLENGADPNNTVEGAELPLTYAIHSHRPAIVQKLIEHGADVNQLSVNGYAPLTIAYNSFRGKNPDAEKVVRLLQAAGAQETQSCCVIL